jgi:isocitrate/isopropylmalate dehydrogenase
VARRAHRKKSLRRAGLHHAAGHAGEARDARRLPGPIGHQAYPKGKPNAINLHPILRKHYDLFANIRPAKSYAGLPSLYKDVDLIIVRENNEGFPPDRNVFMGNGEFRPSPDRTIGIRVITRGGLRPIVTSCQTCPMGALAAHALQQRGFRSVFFIDGGTQGWLAAGYATVR